MKKSNSPFFKLMLLIAIIFMQYTSFGQTFFKEAVFDGSFSHKYDWSPQLDFGQEGTIEIKFKMKPQRVQQIVPGLLSRGIDMKGAIALISLANENDTRFTVFINSSLNQIGLNDGEKTIFFRANINNSRLQHLALSTIDDKTIVHWNGLQLRDTLDVGYGTGVELPLYLGSSDGMHHHFNGELHNVRLWNRALSQSEISSVRAMESIPDTNVLYTNLVAYSEFTDTDQGVYFAHDPVYSARTGDFLSDNTYLQHVLKEDENYIEIVQSYNNIGQGSIFDLLGFDLITSSTINSDTLKVDIGPTITGGAISTFFEEGEYIIGVAGTKNGQRIQSLRFITNKGPKNMVMLSKEQGAEPFFTGIPSDANLIGLEFSRLNAPTETSKQFVITGIGLLYSDKTSIEKLSLGKWTKNGENDPILNDELAMHYSHTDSRDSALHLHGNYKTPEVFDLELDLEADQIIITGEIPRKLSDTVAQVIGPYVFNKLNDNTYQNEEYNALIKFNDAEEFELISEKNIIQIDSSDIFFNQIDTISADMVIKSSLITTITQNAIQTDSGTVVVQDTLIETALDTIIQSVLISPDDVRVDTIIENIMTIVNRIDTAFVELDTTITTVIDTTFSTDTILYVILGSDSIRLEGAYYDTLFTMSSGIYSRSMAYEITGKDKNEWGGTFTLNQKPTLFEHNFKGYNLAKMHPKDYQLGTGSSKMLFQMPKGNSHDYYITSTDKIVPFGLIYKNNRKSMFRANTHMVSSESDYKKAWSVKAGFSLGVPGMSFGANFEHKESTDHMRKSKQQHSVTTSHETKYALVMDKTKMKLSDEFANAILDLRNRYFMRGSRQPATNNMLGTIDIMAFFEKYGTHYPYAVTYGGMAYQEINYTNDEIISEHTSGTDISAKASGTVEGITLGVSGGGGSSADDKFSNVVEDKTTVAETIGGDISFGGDGIGWSLPDNSEVPVFLDLRPISELFSPLYFDDDVIYTVLREMVSDSLFAYEKKYPVDAQTWADSPTHVQLEVTFDSMTDPESGDLDNNGEWVGSFTAVLDSNTVKDLSSTVISHKIHSVWTLNNYGHKDGTELDLKDSPEKFRIHLTDLATCQITVTGNLTEDDGAFNPNDLLDIDGDDVLNCKDFTTTPQKGTLIFNEKNNGSDHATINYSYRLVPVNE